MFKLNINILTLENLGHTTVNQDAGLHVKKSRIYNDVFNRKKLRWKRKDGKSCCLINKRRIQSDRLILRYGTISCFNLNKTKEMKELRTREFLCCEKDICLAQTKKEISHS